MAYSPKNPNGQATMTNSDPVVIASNQSTIPVAIAQSNAGVTNGVQITALTYPQSTGNNSVIQLASGATFTGAIETVLSLQAAQIMVTCDQPYSVFIDQFIDLAGTKLVGTSTFTRLTGVPLNENVTLPGNYMRVRITNTGSSATTTFRLDTTFGIMNTQPNTLSNLGNLRVVAQENGVVSTVNSTSTNLAGGGVFTGQSEDASEFSTAFVSIFSSHVSATDGLSVQFSSNGTDWDLINVFTIPAATGKVFSFGVLAKFFRLVYTNGATLTTSFRVQTLFSRTIKKLSSQRPSDARINDNDFEEVLSYLMGYNGTTWDRLRATIANGLAVDVTRMPTLTKGTQATTGVSTQNLKDAGRNQSNFWMAVQILSTNTDALMSLTGYKGGVAVAATTTPAVVTAGKTFRITSIIIDYTTIITTPGSVRFTLRANLSGVVAIGSPAVFTMEIGEPTGSAPVAGKKNTISIPFPDGLEFAAGTGIGASMVGLNTVGVATAVGYGRIVINGYEY